MFYNCSISMFYNPNHGRGKEKKEKKISLKSHKHFCLTSQRRGTYAFWFPLLFVVKMEALLFQALDLVLQLVLSSFKDEMSPTSKRKLFSHFTSHCFINFFFFFLNLASFHIPASFTFSRALFQNTQASQKPKLNK